MLGSCKRFVNGASECKAAAADGDENGVPALEPRRWVVNVATHSFGASFGFSGSFGFGAHIGLTSVELRAPPLHKRAFELFAGEECDCKLAVKLVAFENAIKHVASIDGAAAYRGGGACRRH